jgi:thioredoxin 1
MKEAIIAFLIALVVGAGINQWMSSQPTPEQAQSDAANAATENIPDTSEATFSSDVLQAQTPVVVDFYATWCGPCKMMMPIVSKLANRYNGRVKFVRVDIDKNKTLASEYQVTAIPTFVFFKDGKRGETFTGAVPEEALAQGIEKTL